MGRDGTLRVDRHETRDSLPVLANPSMASVCSHSANPGIGFRAPIRGICCDTSAFTEVFEPFVQVEHAWVQPDSEGYRGLRFWL